MTALEQYQQPPRNGAVAAWSRPADLPVANRAVVALTEWAHAAQAAHQVAELLVATSFVPEQFRGKPHECTAAILAGDELGMSPMQSIQAFNIIQGQAAPKAFTQRAVVQSRGHEVWKVESNEHRAVFRGRRAGSTVVQESVWTIDRARKMKLAGKPNWQLQPEAMLIARATGEVCRLVAADALMGMAYNAEELADGLDEPAEPQTEPAPQRTVQRRAPARTTRKPAPTEPPSPGTVDAPPAAPAGGRAAAPTPPGPPLPGEDGYDQPAEQPADETAAGGGRKATTEQNRMMHALFREAELGGKEDRAARLQLTGLLLNRELDTSAGLSVADASAVIDALVRLKESGHPDGLAGAAADLLNEDDLRREAAAEQVGQDDADAEQAAADDDARSES